MRKAYCLPSLILVLCLALAALLAGSFPAKAAVLFSDDFEDGNSSGWSTSNGSWSVVTDGNRVYKQSGTSTTAHAYRGTSTWANYSVQARAKALSFNGTDRYFGICARFQSSSNYYFLSLSNGNRLDLRKKVGGALTSLASKTYPVAAGTWYTLRLSSTAAAFRPMSTARWSCRPPTRPCPLAKPA
jgi:pectate lyase